MKYQTFFGQGQEICKECKRAVYTLINGLCRKCSEKAAK